MPAPELFERRNWVTYWARAGTDVHGQPTVTNSPVEFLVRWVGSTTQMQDPNGDAVTVDATAKLPQEVTIGGLMILGRLSDLVGTAGTPPGDALYIRATNYTQDVKGRFSQRTCGLIRRRDVPST